MFDPGTSLLDVAHHSLQHVIENSLYYEVFQHVDEAVHWPETRSLFVRMPTQMEVRLVAEEKTVKNLIVLLNTLGSLIVWPN